jgi:saccharopine dehydrogenase (NAD+, L-lysine-forming)
MQLDLDMQKKFLILGGYGNTGFLIARLLLQESDIHIVIAGRNLSRAQQAANDLNRKFNADRASSKQVDAADTNSLEAAFEGVDTVVVASSTIDYARNVAGLALEAGTDYLDIQLSSPAKLVVLNSLREKIERKKRCFITDGGFHPGVPAAMVRYATTKFDTLEVANIGARFQLNWKKLQFSESTISEFIDELKNFTPLVLKNKKWIKMSMKELPKFDFGEIFGEKYCAPMLLEELRSLPNAIPSLKETGFYIAGFNWMTDYIIMPIAFAAVKMFREKAKGPMGKLFRWGLKNFSKPPFGAILQLEATGLKDKKNRCMHMRLTHNDAYVLTAVPVVACLLQYLNGSIEGSGLWFQANWVEPIQFFRDIERLGVTVSIQIK